MRDLSVRKSRKSISKEKKCVKDVFTERLEDIKKRLEFDKDLLLTPPKKHHNDSLISRFEVFGGSSKREAWDEAIIYGTEDEYLEEEEKELQYIDAFQKQQLQRMHCKYDYDSTKAYNQGCQEFTQAIQNALSPNTCKRMLQKTKKYRGSGTHCKSEDNDYEYEYRLPDQAPDGSYELIDGILAIGPDDLLHSNSQRLSRSLKKSSRLTSPECILPQNNIKINETENSRAKSKDLMFHPAASIPSYFDESTQYPENLFDNDVNLLSPSKQTQTDVHDIQTFKPSKNRENPSIDSKTYSDIMENVNGEMQSFTKSLEQLDEAIYLHSLARKHHHSKRSKIDPNKPDETIPETVRVEREYTKVQCPLGKTQFKSHKPILNNYNSNAFELKGRKTNESPMNFSTNGHDLESPRNHTLNSESRNQHLQRSTFLTESYHMDGRNHQRELNAEEVRKQIFDTDPLLDPLFPKRSTGVKDQSNMSLKIYQRILNIPKPHHTNTFLASVDEQTKWRHEREKQESHTGTFVNSDGPRKFADSDGPRKFADSNGSRKFGDSDGSRKSSSSKQSEETVFNITTDFSDKRLKQSNLYLEESPRDGHRALASHLFFDVESSQVKSEASFHRKTPISSGFNDDGPMTLKELEVQEDEIMSYHPKSKLEKSFRELKKLREENLENIVPKLDLGKLLTRNGTDSFDSTSQYQTKEFYRPTRTINKNKERKSTNNGLYSSLRSPRGRILDQNYIQECPKERRSLSHFDEQKLFKDVRELRESVDESGRHHNFDPEQALLDADSVTDASLDLSRIENCSSIGPWEVGSRSPRDSTKNSIKRQHNLQSHSSPSKSFKNDNALKQFHHSAPVHNQNVSKESKKHLPYDKVYAKTGTEVNFTDLKEMHQDIVGRLRHSDNLVHVLDIDGINRSALYTGMAQQKSQFINDDKKSDHTEASCKPRRKKRVTKPIHVHSLLIKQSRINTKDAESDSPKAESAHVKKKIQNSVFNTSLIKFDPNEPKKLFTNVNKPSEKFPYKSSHNRPVSLDARKAKGSVLRVKERDTLSFEERGKKLDEICGLLSHNIKTRPSAKDIQVNTQKQSSANLKPEQCSHKLEQSKQCPVLHKHEYKIKKMQALLRTDKNNDSPKVRPVDIQFGIGKKKRPSKLTKSGDGRNNLEEADVEENKINRLRKIIKSDDCQEQYHQLQEDEKHFQEFLNDLESEPLFDDMNFNSAPRISRSETSVSELKSKLADNEDEQQVVHDKDNVIWLSKALKEKYDNRRKQIASDHFTGLPSEDEVSHSPSEDEQVQEEFNLTMSDMYTPVTQLITEELEEPATDPKQELPLKTVLHNLLNKKKSKKLKELSKQSKYDSPELSHHLEELEKIPTKLCRVNGTDDGKENNIKSPHAAMEIPTKEINFKANNSGNGANSVDVILSHLENEDCFRLLQKLYTVDDKTRQQLIIKAEYFKRWQRNIKKSKEERLVYGPIKARAEEFHKKKLLLKYFLHWKNESKRSHNEKKAEELHRHHMLNKGLQAFKWAIYRSQHYYDIMKSRTHNIILHSLFIKWKKRTYQQRYNRMSLTFTHWYQFTVEQKRAKKFTEIRKHKLLKKSFSNWSKRYKMKLKENLADQFSRKSMLSSCVFVWKIFTKTSQIKRQRLKQAVVLYSHNLERKYFTKMVESYNKVQKAKQLYRHHVLLRVLSFWKAGSELSYLERQEDIIVSDQHWATITTKSIFYYWREELWIKRAVLNDKLVTQRHVFCAWKMLWLNRKDKNQQIITKMASLKLCRVFSTWRQYLQTQKVKRDKMASTLENVLLQVKFNDWHQYTDYKTQLRMKCELFHKKYNINRQRESFVLWMNKHRKRMNIQKTRQRWSDTCVRKCIEIWKIKCRKTQLNNLLIDSEPDRNLSLMSAMFRKWQTAKWRLDEEKQEADLVREQLQRCKLHRMFTTWRTAMEQLVKIQPMIQTRQYNIVQQCFDAWCGLNKHKLQCNTSHNAVVKNKMAAMFIRWKRQYEVVQIEKKIEQMRLKKLTRCCLSEWRSVVKRKQSADNFHKHQIQSYFFKYWTNKTSQQINDKMEAIEQQERSDNLKEYYFNIWLENSARDKMIKEDKILTLRQHQNYVKLQTTFYRWKHQLHITLVARIYEKALALKHLKQVLRAWSKTTEHSLQDSVTQFSVRLGLPVNNTERLSYGSDRSYTDRCSIRSVDNDYDDSDETETIIQYSPRSHSSYSTSLNRLFTGYPGDRSDIVDKLDLDNQSLLSGIESAIIDERETKIQRLQELVSTFITRLRNWPVSIVFNQWKEFIIRQRELKEAAYQVEANSKTVKLKLALRFWQTQFDGLQKAKQHRNKVLLSNIIHSLQTYQKTRVAKKKLSSIATNHHRQSEMKKFFPIWLEKLKEKQHKESILHLWSTATEEEKELLPLEANLSSTLNRRSLKLCFSIWQIKYQFVVKLQHAYNKGILKRSFSEWKTWTKENRERNAKCEEFRKKHVQLHVFKTWKLRLQQEQETQDRYQKAWQGYLYLVFQRWHQWAKDNHHRQILAKQVTINCNFSKLQQSFSYWKTLTHKSQMVARNHQRQICSQAFNGWKQILHQKKEERRTVLQFQVQCYTSLVENLFKKWKERYATRLHKQAEKQTVIRHKALELGKKWRKKARKSRGQQLFKELQQRKVAGCFSKWKVAYNYTVELENKLGQYTEDKNQDLVSRMLLHWKNRLLLNHFDQVYQTKLQITVFQEWVVWAKAKKERRIRGLALQKALEERSLHVYFKLWLAKTKVNQMVQTHFNVKLQIRTIQSWHQYTQKKKILDSNYSVMAAKVRRNILSKTFSSLRSRFDYCVALDEVAQKIQDDQNKAVQRRSLLLWHEKLDRIMSSRCYGKFLAWRVARQWRNFVCRKKAQRQKEADQEEMARQHYNKSLCKMVFNVMKRERNVNIQREKRSQRLVNKYGRLWKWKVDLSHTAKCVDLERVIKKYWKVWRLVYSRKKAVNKVESFSQRQLVSKVFGSWRNLIKKPPLKSSIPVAVPDNGPNNILTGFSTYNGGLVVQDTLDINVTTGHTPIHSKSLSNSISKITNGLTKSNIRKIITRSDKSKSKIPSPSGIYK